MLELINFELVSACFAQGSFAIVIRFKALLVASNSYLYFLHSDMFICMNLRTLLVDLMSCVVLASFACACRIFVGIDIGNCQCCLVSGIFCFAYIVTLYT